MSSEKESEKHNKRVHLIITGRVQGVFFRAYARDMARSLSVLGWVKNCQDGSVETVAEGSEADVLSYVEWCRRGPAHAEVKNIQIEWQDCRFEFNSFEVRYT